ncbi:hypothetical protein P7K49_019770 [Saguinus oedipus]|uniref:Uncharacterized protein n=1 Tax=Saguinus oedipus TaxID=9490 RepID=A0ABQ9UYF2_SAGOE|nr:hypothetical protein P7K49_019770 [Saguinus oedipus]
MRGAETQASRAAPPSSPPAHPSLRPPAPGHRGGNRAGAGRGGRSGGARAGGGGGSWAGREVGGWWGGRKRKKIFSVSPPAESVCGLGENVSDILGRSRGRAGSERPRDSPSLEPCPPGAPQYCEPRTLRRSIPETARRRDLRAPPPPFPLPLQVSQAGKKARPPRRPGPPPRRLGEGARRSRTGECPLEAGQAGRRA